MRIGPADPLGPVDRDPDGARDLACDLTASDAVCAPPTAGPPPDLPDIGSAPTGAPGFGNVLVILLVIALVAAIVWIVVMAVRRGGDVGDADGEDLDEELDDAVPRIIDEAQPPDLWRRAAEEHRAAGHFRDAVRCEYRALVGDLARAGFVDEIPGRTSGEERLQVAELAPDVGPAFDEAADIFDEAWFDDGEVVAGHDERFRAAERVVLDHVMAGAGRSGNRRRHGEVG